jgi:hypothetical protein
MDINNSKKSCPSCGCKDKKKLPFSDGKTIKWISACSKCESLNDDRIVAVYYEPCIE